MVSQPKSFRSVFVFEQDCVRIFVFIVIVALLIDVLKIPANGSKALQ